MDKKKFSLGLRIDKVTPAHVYFSMFSAMIPEEMRHEEATRAKAGELCMRVEEVIPFIKRTAPDILMRLNDTCEDYFNEIIQIIKEDGRFSLEEATAFPFDLS